MPPRVTQLITLLLAVACVGCIESDASSGRSGTPADDSTSREPSPIRTPELPAAERAEPNAYLVALDSVIGRLPGNVSTCVATRFLWDQTTPVPTPVLDTLAGAGWDLREPDIPTDTASFMVFVGRVREEDGAWLIRAGYTTSSVSRGSVHWWTEEWRHRVTCEGTACSLVDVVGFGHGDGSGSLQEYSSQPRPSCGDPSQASAPGAIR